MQSTTQAESSTNAKRPVVELKVELVQDVVKPAYGSEEYCQVGYLD